MSEFKKTTKPYFKKKLESPTQKALSRWDGEGGAGPDGPQKSDPDLEFKNSKIKPQKQSNASKSVVKKRHKEQ